MKTTYRVDGMTCGGCANSVTRAVQAIDPGKQIQVEVDLDAKTVTVDGVDDAALVSQAVADAGFDYVGPVADAG